MKQLFDVEAIRARLSDTDVPADVGMAYLQVLTNLNALSHLMIPSVDLQDEPGQEELEKVFQRHEERRTALESQYPALAVAARPKGWAGN